MKKEIKMSSQNIYHSIVFWLKYFYNVFYLKCLSFSLKSPSETRSSKCENLEDTENYLYPIPVVKGLPLVGTIFDLIAAGGAPK